MTNAYPSQGPVPMTPSGIATTAAGQEALENFLTARGLDVEVAVKLGWTASGGFIEIPYFRDGSVRNRKYRSVVGKEFRQDGGKQFFWNIDVLKDESLKDQPLIITEGEFDALAAIQAGYPRTMSVPNGAPANAGVATLGYLLEVEDQLRKIPQIILAFDDDEPGINLQKDFIARLGKARCKWLKYPRKRHEVTNHKDLNEALLEYGARGVQETIRNAQWVGIPGLSLMSDIPQATIRQPYPIGIPGFEKHFNIRLGDFCVVTGIPGHGKTAFVSDVICRMAAQYGFVTAIASFEEEPTTDLRRRLRTWYTQKLEKNMTEDEKKLADNWINSRFVFAVPADDDNISLEWVIEKAAGAAVRYGAKIILIDPWNELDHLREKDETITEYTGRCIKELKRFAKKYEVFLIVVAHPAKMERNKDGEYPMPTLYNISDSAHWYNKPDVGIVVHRGASGDVVRIAKSKHHTEIGIPETVPVFFELSTGRYTAKGQGPVYASMD